MQEYPKIIITSVIQLLYILIPSLIHLHRQRNFFRGKSIKKILMQKSYNVSRFLICIEICVHYKQQNLFRNSERKKKKTNIRQLEFYIVLFTELVIHYIHYT